jgi:hypothetical protein
VNLVAVDKIQHEAVFVVVEEAYIRIILTDAKQGFGFPATT